MSKKNFKLTIQYLGTPYKGWQYQPDCSTVQEEIESAFKKILHKNQQKINLIGSGRTDSGVHALGQVANIIIHTTMTSKELKNAINANISNNIFINDCCEVDLNFNSRFSARKRCYIYKITSLYAPFIHNLEWFNEYQLDLDLMNKAAELIIGKHNFTLLSKANSEIENKYCEISYSSWESSDNKILYTIMANRFLHHMVRYLVGTMIEVGKGNISIDNFNKLLNNKTNNRTIFKAPAHGLYLKEVYYE